MGETIAILPILHGEHSRFDLYLSNAQGSLSSEDHLRLR
ncbi:hypothetical protein NIES2104_11800 [Leptolyngbya sp. NIES-2104]|nr:hypothetical protein NIES2104_11800 [Leptolyngbya sp. NIES-2104]